MSEHFFHITTTKPNAAIAKKWNKIAKKYDGRYVEVNRKKDSQIGINHGNYQGWFAIPNRGNPFDGITSNKIMEECNIS